jgi:type IV secretory pathway VirB10-like protein
LRKSSTEIPLHSLPPEENQEGEKMKLQQLAVITTALAVQACSTSKETYTETRTLTYPKKSVPHIKDFYLQNQQAEPTPPVNAPVYAGILPDNDVLPQGNPEQELERLQHQNALLSAQIYNETLRNQLTQ